MKNKYTPLNHNLMIPPTFYSILGYKNWATDNVTK